MAIPIASKYMAEEKDVDLYDELKKTLESSEKSGEEENSGASSEEPTEEKTSEKENQEPELSEEEISKLSPRAQKRIRDLAEEVKKLAEKPKPEEDPKEGKPEPEEEPQEEKIIPPKFNNVQEFLAAVQDEPSRKLLENFYEVIKGETSNILAPVEKANNEAKFETEFAKYEKIEGLSDYKNDLKKTFLRNPNQSLKALVGEVITDLNLSKVKPIEKKSSSPNRAGKIDTSNLSKDELYDLLDTLK